MPRLPSKLECSFRVSLTRSLFQVCSMKRGESCVRKALMLHDAAHPSNPCRWTNQPPVEARCTYITEDPYLLKLSSQSHRWTTWACGPSWTFTWNVDEMLACAQALEAERGTRRGHQGCLPPMIFDFFSVIFAQILVKFHRNFADISESVENFRIFWVF